MAGFGAFGQRALVTLGDPEGPTGLGAATTYTGEYASASPNLTNYGTIPGSCIEEQPDDAGYCLSAKARTDIVNAVDIPLAQTLAQITGSDITSQLMREAASRAGSCAKRSLYIDCASKGYVDEATTPSIPHIHTPEGSAGSPPPFRFNPAIFNDATSDAAAPGSTRWSTGTMIAAGAALVAVGVGVTLLWKR